MWTKRSTTAVPSSTGVGYPNSLKRFCEEEDVLIIPQFVTLLTSKQAEFLLFGKSKETVVSDLYFKSGHESKVDDNAVRPPQVGIIYSNPDDKETPIAVVCRNIYVEYSFITAIKKSFNYYQTITTLKIENCCISKEIAESLAFLLSDDAGRRITELSLDGNEDIARYLPLYLILPTGIKYLSLQRCSLNDEDAEGLAVNLAFTDEKEHKLQLLNLGMNKIGNLGAAHLAKALRTNRSIVSLSLIGNQIEDEGALYLSEVLQKFPLTFEEVVARRRRNFDKILKKKADVERYLELIKAKKEDEQALKPSSKRGERVVPMGRRIRGLDGKIRCVPIKDLKPKGSAMKSNSGEKFRGREQGMGEEITTGIELTPSEISAAVQQVESETLPDKHPFSNEVFLSEDELWCYGCWSLANLNLAFNCLTENSAEYFTEVANYQRENFKFPKMGLLRILLLPGNSIKDNSEEYQNFQAALALKSTKKDIPESAESTAAGSLTSARRMSSSGRRIKKA